MFEKFGCLLWVSESLHLREKLCVLSSLLTRGGYTRNGVYNEIVPQTLQPCMGGLLSFKYELLRQLLDCFQVKLVDI